MNSFLDVSLVFAEGLQIYLLALSAGTVDADRSRAREGGVFAIWAIGDRAGLVARGEARWWAQD